MPKKKQLPAELIHSEAYVKDFFDMAVPSTVRFNVDHFICGDSYRCVWAIREYPPQTTDQAILSRFGDKEAVTLHLYPRLVDGAEQSKILQNASRKNTLLANSNDIEDMVTGEGNLGDVVSLLNNLRRNREPLLHCAVFLELSANSLDKLRELQSDVAMELTREKLSVDRLTLRQKEGFLVYMPCGYNVFGTQFERVLPASSVANCYPFNYSGKTDPNGFYIGKDITNRSTEQQPLTDYLTARLVFCKAARNVLKTELCYADGIYADLLIDSLYYEETTLSKLLRKFPASGQENATPYVQELLTEYSDLLWADEYLKHYGWEYHSVFRAVSEALESKDLRDHAIQITEELEQAEAEEPEAELTEEGSDFELSM